MNRWQLTLCVPTQAVCGCMAVGTAEKELYTTQLVGAKSAVRRWPWPS